MDVMTPEEFAAKMREIYPDDNRYDPESAHGKADELMMDALRSLGYDVSRFDDADRWYA